MIKYVTKICDIFEPYHLIRINFKHMLLTTTFSLHTSDELISSTELFLWIWKIKGFLIFLRVVPLRENWPYLEFFWSVFSPNARKYGPEKLRIQTLLTHCIDRHQLHEINCHCTKNEFSIIDFFGKYYQICRKLRIWSHQLKKSLMENFIFCAVWVTKY